ncbi:MAG: hypothetical protein MPK06_02800 [Alphaproteobacteria bacterium]|nr:hypothetical protein [Alphaproteobacteria bacterium]MDA8003587.1 hypothetical protein [Alphaproteobacteria bacterium]MDA8005455.1 hypothetical protein [Alphaproteobacteria bacterium]MDA8012935.1 hypothetical protein [Alphaproteobacteria bacterium]
MTECTALLDANVLYSSLIRDICLSLSRAGVFRGRWTDKIHQEWMRALRENDPRITPERLERIRARINGASPDGPKTRMLAPRLYFPEFSKICY